MTGKRTSSVAALAAIHGVNRAASDSSSTLQDSGSGWSRSL
jgi:hypothetical protein